MNTILLLFNKRVGILAAILLVTLFIFYLLIKIHILQDKNIDCQKSLAVEKNVIAQEQVMHKSDIEHVKKAQREAAELRAFTIEETENYAEGLQIPDDCENAVRVGVIEGRKLR